MMRIKLKVCAGILLSVGIASCSGKKASSSNYVYNPPAAPVDKGWLFEATPAWSDEFNYSGTPDTSKWTYDLGAGGWGNAELEDYTKALTNVSVDTGILTITARKESLGGAAYTSARMVSKGAGST